MRVLSVWNTVRTLAEVQNKKIRKSGKSGRDTGKIRVTLDCNLSSQTAIKGHLKFLISNIFLSSLSADCPLSMLLQGTLFGSPDFVFYIVLYK